MKKRVAAALLWFYATWVVWTMVAQFVGMSELLGPVLGVAAGLLAAGDPTHRIWVRAPEAVGDGPKSPSGARQVA